MYTVRLDRMVSQRNISAFDIFFLIPLKIMKQLSQRYYDEIVFL